MSHADGEQITAYLAGTLGQGEKESAEAHFEYCIECRRQLYQQTLALPFQPITIDGKPRTPGMTPQTLRCGWGRLIRLYVEDGRMNADSKRRMTEHYVRCESCAGQLAIYLGSSSWQRASSLPLLQQVRQWVSKRLATAAFWRKGKGLP